MGDSAAQLAPRLTAVACTSTTGVGCALVGLQDQSLAPSTALGLVTKLPSAVDSVPTGSGEGWHAARRRAPVAARTVAA